MRLNGYQDQSTSPNVIPLGAEFVTWFSQTGVLVSRGSSSHTRATGYIDEFSRYSYPNVWLVFGGTVTTALGQAAQLFATAVASLVFNMVWR